MNLNELKKSIKTESKNWAQDALKYFDENETIQQKEEFAKRYYKKSIDALYKKNHATTDNQKIKVLKNLIKSYYQRFLNKDIATVEHMEALLNSDLKINKILIAIEWKKSRTWGNNPYAEVKVVYNNNQIETFTGSASGCGYDKRSGATAQALNKCELLKALLYKAENKRLKNHSEVTRRDFIGYGSGYGAIPRFEGGVGFRSHETILNNLNFKTSLYDESSATYDLYIFEA